MAQVDKAAIKAENKVVGRTAPIGLDMLTGTAANPVACFTTCLADASELHSLSRGLGPHSQGLRGVE